MAKGIETPSTSGILTLLVVVVVVSVLTTEVTFNGTMSLNG